MIEAPSRSGHFRDTEPTVLLGLRSSLTIRDLNSGVKTAGTRAPCSPPPRPAVAGRPGTSCRWMIRAFLSSVRITPAK